MDNKNSILITIFVIMTIVSSMFFTTSSAGSDIKAINTDELHTLIVDNAYQVEAGREKHFTIIDARTKEEYSKSHIFSAINIPLSSFNSSPSKLPSDKNALIVVYCNDAKHETSIAWAGKAITAGYTNLTIYADGFMKWKSTKMPVVN